MISRIKKFKKFTVVGNDFLNEEQMSWKAKGLLTYLLSLPDDWKIHMSDLKNRAKDGRDSTMNGMKELIDFGYAKFTERREKGKIMEYDYVVSDEKSLLTENSITENSPTVSPKLLNTNKPNTNQTKKDIFPSGKIYKKAVDRYFEFYEKKFGLKPKFDGVQGKSMKALLKNLAQIIETKDEEKILESLDFIFNNWHLLDKFNQKQIELKNINGNLNNIILQLKKANKKEVGNEEDFRNFLNL